MHCKVHCMQNLTSCTYLTHHAGPQHLERFLNSSWGSMQLRRGRCNWERLTASHLCSRRQRNDGLIDVLYLVKERVHARLGCGIVCDLTSQICNEVWQLVVVQIVSAICIVPNQTAIHGATDGYPQL